jgi:putative phosphoribosyl transferase
MRIFGDRHEAGRLLAERLLAYAGRPDVVVLGLARGGVPVAFEVAQRLRALLDVCVVRKLGVPGQEELAMGAVATGGTIVINREVVDSLRIPGEIIDAAARREAYEVVRREQRYRDGRERLELRNRTVILIDDGLATGATMAAAVLAVREEKPATIVVAAPVGAASTIDELRNIVDEVVCLETPESFYAVGQWYIDFTPTTDEEVRELVSGGTRQTRRPEVSIPAGAIKLKGDLIVPSNAHGVVLFAHGAGSSRHSPRNQSVARILREEGFATLLMDLLTEEEEESERLTGALRFDIDLLARRLVRATDWVVEHASMRGLPLGYFGASTGAAAALVAATERPDQVGAIVSRGGRPDLARSFLSRVRAPTLLIVGGKDPLVLELNREALDELQVEKRLAVVPKATHLFEEPGALERVAELAVEWFEAHLSQGVQPSRSHRRERAPSRSKT